MGCPATDHPRLRGTKLEQLAVATPGTTSGYSRTLFAHWRDATRTAEVTTRIQVGAEAARRAWV